MKKLLKTVVSAVLFFAVLWGIIQFLPVGQVAAVNPFMKTTYGRPLIIAHGGAKDLFPENTMVAFDGSMAIGVDMLEIDVCLTADDVLITHHNLTIDATTDGTGPVHSYTFEELEAFNFGAKFVALDGSMPYKDDHVAVTSLESVFAKYPEMLFNVEIKDEGDVGLRAAELLYDMIVAYNLEAQVLVPSFSDANIQQFRAVSMGNIMTSSASDETKLYIYLHLVGLSNLLRHVPYESMQLPPSDSGIRLDSDRLMGEARRRNIAIHYWTIDDPAIMKSLIRKGADGIITDRPDLMHAVLAEMGYE